MKAIDIYLFFDGNAREAMTFYAECLGAELSLQTFRESKMSVPEGAEDRIIHARLSKGSVVVMASDTIPGDPFLTGANFSICVDCDDVAEQDRIFAALDVGSRNVRPPEDTFWGARFGTLTDRFGVNWMLNCQRQQAG